MSCADLLRTSTAKFDAETRDLAKNWRPSGRFTVPDLERVINATHMTLRHGGAAVEQAIASGYPPEIRNQLRSVWNRIQTRFGDSLPFVYALNEARSKSIRVVDAPGLKNWVLQSMVAVSVGMGAVAYYACDKPAIVAAFQTFMVYFDRTIAVVKTIANATIAAGESLLKIPDTLGTLWTVTKWGTLAALAYYVLKPKQPNPARRRHGRRRRR